MSNDREEAKRLFDEGLSLAEISERLKVSLNTLKSWKRRGALGASAPVEKCTLLDTSAPSKDAVRKRQVRTRQKLAKLIEEAVDLTDREKNFCIAYLGCWNATQAAYAAGYTGTHLSVKNMAYELLKKPHIDRELSRFKEIKRMAILADGDDIIEYHQRLAFSDITQYVNIGKGGGVHLKKSDQIDGQLVKKISWGKSPSIELKDSGKSLEFLGKRIGVESSPGPDINQQALAIADLINNSVSERKLEDFMNKEAIIDDTVCASDPEAD